MPRPDPRKLEARNAKRRSLKPEWLRRRGRRGAKVHTASTCLEGRARCGARLEGRRWATAEAIDAAHPKTVARMGCRVCAMVHEPAGGAWGPVHLPSRDRENTVCGMPLTDVRWSSGYYRKLGMCPLCARPSAVVDRQLPVDVEPGGEESGPVGG